MTHAPLRRLRGTVARVLSYGIGGGAIFVLTVPPAKRVRVVAKFNVMLRAPVVGETWEVSGTFEHHSLYGAQLKAQSGVCRQPSGIELVSLLGKHPSFATIGVRAAKKLWKKFGARLPGIFDHEDVRSLDSAGLSAPAAIAGITAWHRYLDDLRIVRALEPLALSGHERSTLPDVIAVFRGLRLTTPYDFHPAIHWSTIDSSVKNSRPPHEPSRLVSASDAVFVLGRQAILRAIPLKEYERRLAINLRDPDLVQTARDSSVAAGRLLNLTYRRERFVASDALTKVTHAFLSRMFASKGVTQVHGDAFTTVDTPRQTAASVCLIDCGAHTDAAARAWLQEVLADALHVGFSDEEPHPARHQSLQQMLAGPAQVREAGNTVVVHSAHALDILTLNKLIHRLPVDTSLILAGTLNVVTRPNRPAPYHALWYSGLFQRITLRSTGSPEASELPISSIHRDGLEIRKVQVSGMKDTLSEALALYRENACDGTTVLISANGGICHLLNVKLSSERVDELEYDKLPVNSTALGRSGRAYDKCPVTWKQADIAKCRWPGESMTLHDVEQTPYIRVTNSIPEFVVAQVTRANGDVAPLTASDAFELTLAYALELPTAALGTWQTVIVVCIDSSNCNAELIRAASGLASRTVVLVGDVDASLKREGRDAWYGADPLLQHLLQKAPETSS
ncbi:hypothetical protein VOM14_16205 [Paraburkholderia sp. MPAMCS5]|uniref:hypothetical protein n=1 Tax=Paraburkholderia sp. MPAMCS5 TaxID=3112563 RepID=UPI002E1916E4|nr:hypothetical protein [Paraburkholderia sp. MPAMCS5]